MTHYLYPLQLDDGGRHLSRRPGQYHDCSVRALAILTGQPYDVCYDLLARAGRKPCQGFESDKWLKKVKGRVFGGQFKAVPIIASRPIPRSPTVVLTPSTFGRDPKYLNGGRYLLETPSHTWAVIDGIHHDLWRVKEQPLTGAWQWFPNS